MNKFKSTPFQHSNSEGSHTKVGVLICNLGTPAAPTAKALRPYLKQFLSDPRVVEVPRLLWWLVLNLIILRFRPAKAAKAYKKVWTEQGSPLACITAAQRDALASALHNEYGDQVFVEWAMRYGQPSIGSKIQALSDAGVRKLFVLPLYPQYSATTSASTFDAVADHFKQSRWLPELRFLDGYHKHALYISALAKSIENHWQEHGRSDKLVFSYHGIPQRYLHNGDPYHCYCLQTTRLVVEKLGLQEDEYMTCFQSRFGREPWLQPYTDHSLEQLAKQGTKSVTVICPGFSSDCLETLEEIEEENRDIFLEAGGESFHYIPALNDSAAHVEALAAICKANIYDWLSSSEMGKTSDIQERYNNCRFNRIKES